MSETDAGRKYMRSLRRESLKSSRELFFRGRWADKVQRGGQATLPERNPMNETENRADDWNGALLSVFNILSRLNPKARARVVRTLKTLSAEEDDDAGE